MRGFLGWVLLLPLVGAFALTAWIARACVQKGGLWRLLGALSSLGIGGICIVVGYQFKEEGITIFGWVAMVSGGLIAAIGAGSALFGMKE